MATVITAGNATNGLSFTADNTGSLDIKTGTGAGTTALSLSSSQIATFAGAASVPGNLSFNSGYGSAAVAYGCRAWVNFNGVTTATIRASGNVSSVTRNSVGNYTINFTNAMPDANYCPVVGMSQGAAAGGVHQLGQTGPNLNSNNFAAFGTGSLKIVTGSPVSSAPFDVDSLNIAIFR